MPEMDNDTIIKLENVHKSFDEKKVHKGVNLEIKRGENLTVLGGSGSGKSVLLKEINGLIKPDSGDVVIEGNSIIDFDESELTEIRKNIGMLFQGAALFDSLSVEENIAYSLVENTDMSDEEIVEVVKTNLELVGLPGIEDKYPNDLSGGMKKRVGLARALAITPKIILYDEPTTGLDPPNISRINELIDCMKEEHDITGVIITHDIESAYKISDRVAFLHDGKIVFVGTVDEARNTDVEVFSNFLNGIMEED
jgi:phospholipid/cholesterol/gamma-HCH transport system ATP-binding protein